MMSVPMKKAWSMAEQYEKDLRADDPRFRGCVMIQDEDGTSMMLPWAFAVKYSVNPDQPNPKNSFIIIFTEHHGNQIFSEEEVTSFLSWTGPPNCDPEFIENGVEK